MQFFLRARILSLLVIPLFLGACSHAVNVPRNQYDDTSLLYDVDHKIRTVSGEEYHSAEFWVTESMLVISKLSPSDPRYQTVELPLSIPLSDVASVQRIDHGPPIWAIAVGVGAFIAVMAVLTQGEAFTD